MSYFGPANYLHDVGNGEVPNRTLWSKFGYNDDINTATDPEIIAQFGGTWGPAQIMTSAGSLTIAYDNTTDGSGGGATGATQLIISYLKDPGGGADLVLTSAVHVLGSTGSDTTSFSDCLGVNRVVVIASGAAQSNVNDITITATTGGANQAAVPAGGSVTQQAIFHTPQGYNFFADWLWFNIVKVTGVGTPPRVNILGWSYSRVTDTVYEIFRETIDVAIDNSVSINPTVPFVIGGREVLYFTAETDTNATAVRARFSGELRPS